MADGGAASTCSVSCPYAKHHKMELRRDKLQNLTASGVFGLFKLVGAGWSEHVSIEPLVDASRHTQTRLVTPRRGQGDSS